MKFKLPDLFPPIDPPMSYPPTWEDVERLASHHHVVRTAVTMHMRGDLTREEALLSLVFTLADAHQQLHAQEVERRRRTLDPIFVVPGENSLTR